MPKDYSSNLQVDISGYNGLTNRFEDTGIEINLLKEKETVQRITVDSFHSTSLRLTGCLLRYWLRSVPASFSRLFYYYRSLLCEWNTLNRRQLKLYRIPTRTKFGVFFAWKKFQKTEPGAFWTIVPNVLKGLQTQT